MRSKFSLIAVLLIVLLSTFLVGCSGEGPEITITGLDAGTNYGTVTPIVTTDDASAAVSLSLNGMPYFGDPITEMGDYSLKVQATNDLGTSSKTINFSIVPSEYEFIITRRGSEGVQGWSIEHQAKLYYNDDPAYIKSGENSIKVVREASDSNNRSNIRMRPPGNQYSHPEWLADWSSYDTFSAWVYFEDVSVLADDAIQFRIWPEATVLTKEFSRSELTNGWNLLEIDLDTIFANDPSRKYDMTIVEFMVRVADPNTTMTYYYDQWKLSRTK